MFARVILTSSLEPGAVSKLKKMWPSFPKPDTECFASSMTNKTNSWSNATHQTHGTLQALSDGRHLTRTEHRFHVTSAQLLDHLGAAFSLDLEVCSLTLEPRDDDVELSSGAAPRLRLPPVIVLSIRSIAVGATFSRSRSKIILQEATVSPVEFAHKFSRDPHF